MPSQEFAFTGGWQQWEVPADTDYVIVEVRGAGSGGSVGGRVTGRIAVKNSQTLFLMVGEQGNPADGAAGGPRAFGGGGRGGNGRGSGGTGGRGGGGASAIRLNARDGRILCVAGGAGGRSGDAGVGGEGGANVGMSGDPGTAGDQPTGRATGGTQTQPGNGGTSSRGADYRGNDGEAGALGVGGRGGQASSGASDGGGGGGGGYRAGGGGQASAIGYTPGGGGGGGSNYVGVLTHSTNERAGGTTGHGRIVLTWTPGKPANQPPTPPSQVKVDGKDEVSGMATRSKGAVDITARVNDPDNGQKVRMLARWSTRSDFRNPSDVIRSEYEEGGKRASVTIRGLPDNTRIWVRLWAEDRAGKNSVSYNSVNFWTNRPPNPPELQLPPDNSQWSNLDSVTFQWKHEDPDGGTQQTYRLRFRTMGTPSRAAGAWTMVERRTSFNQWVSDPGQFKANRFYEWQVRTRDAQDAWGDWSVPFSFYVSGTAAAPIPLGPRKDRAVDVMDEVEFTWRFLDPDQDDRQTKADIRYRATGTPDWFTHFGTVETPGAEEVWRLPTGTFAPGVQYEWQVRTYDLNSNLSDWSDRETFRAIATPGLLAVTETYPDAPIAGALGCGTNRAFIYRRGGEILVGEVNGASSLSYGRLRDDISTCSLRIDSMQDVDFLADLHCWMHEVVIYRDEERVWEGPITRLTYYSDRVEIEAKDVMAYVYRRIMRQGYRDAYRIIDGKQIGQTSVVRRAASIIANALAPDDPNILPYLTTFNFADDALNSRVVPDYSKTAWEEVDDLAANAGLDYTTVGRRIILWDTHRSIGRLPEMRDGDFSDPPIVSEYGMQLANYYAVTNGNGVWGAATTSDLAHYGLVEMLSSSYGEVAAAPAENMSPVALEALQENLREQAARNIAGRWPTPLVVRVPDNSALNPEAPVTFQQLVPGVWIPLRSTGIRQVSQLQKLDSVRVEDGPQGEQVRVVLSPAPTSNAVDPDAEAAAIEEAG